MSPAACLHCDGLESILPIGLESFTICVHYLVCVNICICGVFGVVWAVGCRTRARLRHPAGRACTTRGGRARGAPAPPRAGAPSLCAPVRCTWPLPCADLRFRIVWEERLIKQSLKSDSLLTRSLTVGSYVDHARAEHRSLHSHLTLG